MLKTKPLRSPITFQSEETVHRQVCTYLQRQYPHVLFNTDLSGIKLTIGQAKKVKTLRSGRAWPDIHIARKNSVFAGLYVELKAPDVRIFKENGELVANTHIREQYEMINELKKEGFAAYFACGFDEAKEIIDNYLKS